MPILAEIIDLAFAEGDRVYFWVCVVALGTVALPLLGVLVAFVRGKREAAAQLCVTATVLAAVAGILWIVPVLEGRENAGRFESVNLADDSITLHLTEGSTVDIEADALGEVDILESRTFGRTSHRVYAVTVRTADGTLHRSTDLSKRRASALRARLEAWRETVLARAEASAGVRE